MGCYAVQIGGYLPTFRDTLNYVVKGQAVPKRRQIPNYSAQYPRKAQIKSEILISAVVILCGGVSFIAVEWLALLFLILNAPASIPAPSIFDIITESFLGFAKSV